MLDESQSNDLEYAVEIDFDNLDSHVSEYCGPIDQPCIDDEDVDDDVDVDVDVADVDVDVDDVDDVNDADDVNDE